MKKWKWTLAGAAGGLTAAAAVHRRLLYTEQEQLTAPGTMVEVNGHRMHVYAEGPEELDGSGGRVHDEAVTLVFLSGGGTAAPVYDFRLLYRKLSSWYRCVVVEKAGYGYSEIEKRSRQLDVMLEETRLALRLAGKKGPLCSCPIRCPGWKQFTGHRNILTRLWESWGWIWLFPRHMKIRKRIPVL